MRSQWLGRICGLVGSVAWHIDTCCNHPTAGPHHPTCRWDSDPYTYGSYSFIKAGASEDVYSELARAVDDKVGVVGWLGGWAGGWMWMWMWMMEGVGD